MGTVRCDRHRWSQLNARCFGVRASYTRSREKTKFLPSEKYNVLDSSELIRYPILLIKRQLRTFVQIILPQVPPFIQFDLIAITSEQCGRLIFQTVFTVYKSVRLTVHGNLKNYLRQCITVSDGTCRRGGGAPLMYTRNITSTLLQCCT